MHPINVGKVLTNNKQTCSTAGQRGQSHLWLRLLCLLRLPPPPITTSPSFWPLLSPFAPSHSRFRGGRLPEWGAGAIKEVVGGADRRGAGQKRFHGSLSEVLRVACCGCASLLDMLQRVDRSRIKRFISDCLKDHLSKIILCDLI